jgi:hypothetical protein
VFNYAKSKYTHIYIYSEPGQVHLAYVVSVIDYNISLFRTASRSNYAIIDYAMLQSPGIVIFRNGMFHWPVCISRVKQAVWAFINKPINISYLKKPDSCYIEEAHLRSNNISGS